MAAQAIPAMMIQRIIGQLAGRGGQPGGQPGAMPGATPGVGRPPDQAGQQISAQLSELNGADPDSTMKLLTQQKGILVALYSRSAFPMPKVAGHIAAAMKSIDKAIEESEKAVATQGAVQPPIANTAGQPMGDAQQNGPGLQQFAMGAQ
jgi:hypothetical protein